MAALAADRIAPDTKQLETTSGGIVLDYNVAASTVIYKGAFVVIDVGGDIIPCATGTAEHCLGIAMANADNSGGADGAITCEVLVGAIIEHTLASVAKADIGDPCYAADDQTLTQTAGTDSFAGIIIQYVSANTCLVQMPKFGGEAA